jgi:hypothetical protein
MPVAPLADPDTIRKFVPAVISAIGMRAHGPLLIERFGGEPTLRVLQR